MEATAETIGSAAERMRDLGGIGGRRQLRQILASVQTSRFGQPVAELHLGRAGRGQRLEHHGGVGAGRIDLQAAPAGGVQALRRRLERAQVMARQDAPPLEIE
jgi:hypothetical protein